MKYIAYGSNMEQDAMSLRCPHARLLGTGMLSNMRLEFYTHATVEPLDGSCVPVAVWEIDERDEKNLDWYEGYPDYYRKEEHIVRMNGGSEIIGMVYLMNDDQRSLLPPGKSYYEGIRKAYMRLGLAAQIRTVLEPALMRSRERIHRK